MAGVVLVGVVDVGWPSPLVSALPGDDGGSGVSVCGDPVADGSLASTLVAPSSDVPPASPALDESEPAPSPPRSGRSAAPLVASCEPSPDVRPPLTGAA